jgi:hypothetical protein
MRRLSVFIMTLLVSACDFPFDQNCKASGWRMTPGDTTVHVGAKFEMSAQVYGCNGQGPFSIDPRWKSSVPAVAQVEERSGKVTARGPGTAEMTVSDARRYGKVPIVVTVTVIPLDEKTSLRGREVTTSSPSNGSSQRVSSLQPLSWPATSPLRPSP